MSILLLIVGLILFVGLVVVHEMGHFFAARRNGIDVEEFGIGFPPRAKVLTKKNGTTYTLNWLPLGGFVKLKGEHDSDTEPGSFGAASLSAKVKVMIAGVGMNLLAAFAILTLVALIGMPKILDNQFAVGSDSKITRQEVLVGYTEPDSPAAAVGLKQRDQLMSIGLPGQQPQTIQSQEQLPGITKEYAGQAVEITFKQDGQVQQKTVTLRDQQTVDASKDTDDPKGYLGVSPTEFTLTRATWSAPIVALGLMKQLTVATLQGLGNALRALVTGHASEASKQVSGPVGVVVLLKDGSLLGVQFILLIVAVISLTLAIMNILPIPALDGGRLFIMLFFRLIHQPLTPKKEEYINSAGFIALMVLFVAITIVDIGRFF